jgi:hypothetical protein
LDSYFANAMFLFFLFHDLNLDLGLPLFIVLGRKLCSLGYFHVRDKVHQVRCMVYTFMEGKEKLLAFKLE